MGWFGRRIGRWCNVTFWPNMMQNRTMKALFYRAVILLMALGIADFSASFAQTPQKSKVPQTPTVRYITSDPATGAVTIYWAGCEHDNLYPDATGYQVYVRRQNALGDWNNDPVGLPQSNTVFSYQDIGAGANTGPVTYTVAALGPDGASPHAPFHTTVFLKATYDTCADEVRLEWTPYIGWGNRVKSYEIYSGESPIWGNLSVQTTVSGTENGKSFKVPLNKNLYYYVKAYKDGDTVSSRSNLVEIRTRDVRVAPNLGIDTIHCFSDRNRITYHIDSLSRVSYFSLLRADGTSEAEMRRTEVEIVRLTRGGSGVAIDTQGGGNVVSGIKHYYYLAAVDECGKNVARSLLKSTVIVRAGSGKEENSITWDELEVAKGHRAEYRVYRTSEKGGEQEEKEIAVVHSGATLECSDDVSEFKRKGFSDQFCYMVKAWELNEQGQRIRVTISKPTCTQVQADVILPTAISPLETGQTQTSPRNVFAPISTFASNYKLLIYNRDGRLLFSGQNRGWDGKLKDGTFAPEGAYIYRVELISPDRSPVVRTGSFMVVYPTESNSVPL